MKKTKFLAIIFLFSLVMPCVLFISSCHFFVHVHDYSNGWISDESYHWQKCSGCEEIYNQEEHCWDEGIITLHPTQTSEGEITFTCDVCEYSKVEKISKNDTHEHSFSDIWSSNETHHWHEADCEHKSETKNYSMHNWNSGIITSEPTDVAQGIKIFTCQTCEKTKIEYIPKLENTHTHIYNQKNIDLEYIASEATCTEKALYFYSCSCGDKGSEMFEYGNSIGHEYSTFWSYDEEYHWHSAICIHADENKDKAEHDWNEGVVTLKPTTENKGETTFTCDTCGKTRVEEIDPEKKKIIFDMNGATSEQIQDIVCDFDTTVVELPVPTLSYDVDYYVTGYDGIYDILPIYKNFDGWYIDGSDIKVTEWNFTESNIATTKLVARWSDYIWTKPVEKRDGYSDILKWYCKNLYTSDFEVLFIDDTAIQTFKNNGFILYGKDNPTEYTITYNNIKNATNVNITKYIVTDNITLLDPFDCIGYDFECWVDENGNKIVNIPSGTIGDITLTAKWKAKIYTVAVKGININTSNKIDSNGNPEYNLSDFGIVYYTYGDDINAQGFYIDAMLNIPLFSNYFDDYYTDSLGNKNFTIGGVFSSVIENNGHTYASYCSEDCVITADFEFVCEPVLSEDLRVGTVFVLFMPNQYTITLNPNPSSQGALVIENNEYSTHTIAYYNEKPNNIATIPASKYYTPISFASSEGEIYFSGNGIAINYYDIGGDTTMYCQWGQIYTDYTYIYDKTTLESIADSGKYLVICDIDMENSNWTPISSFSGEIDGDDHCIYNFTLVKTGGKGSASIGFIKFLSENGVIKDLTLGKSAEETSVEFNIDYDESSSESHLIVGGFVGENEGAIMNCNLINASIYAALGDRNNNRGLYIYVGGIAGLNRGDIVDCIIMKSSIYTEAAWRIADTGDDNLGWLGGIAAKNFGNIDGCSVQETNLILEVDGDGYRGNKAYPFGCLGGIVGEQLNGNILNSAVVDVKRTISASSGADTHPTTYNGEICGLLTGGIIE